MPLYTYVAAYRGKTYADQGRFSNFKGFAAGLLGSIPDNALPGVNKATRQDMIAKAYRCEWQAVANRTGLWRTSFALGDSEFVIHAIQTEG